MKKDKNHDVIEGTYGRMKYVADFLPKPEELVLREPTVKVTLSLSQESVDFFKKEAERLNTSYQRMIRNLLDEYTQRMKRG